MIFSIRFKLFSTLLLATGSVVLCMYLVMLWSFDRGFLDYVNKQDEHKYQSFSQSLASRFKEDGSWQRVTNSGRLWESMLSDSFGLPARFGPSDRERGGFRPPGFSSRPGPQKHNEGSEGPSDLEHDLHRRQGNGGPSDFEGRGHPPGFSEGGFGSRPPPMSHDEIIRPLLLDQDKNVLHGRVKDIADLKLFPIKVMNETVGYVGQLKRKELSDKLDLLFVEQQSKAFMLVAVMMVIICVLAALPVAAHFVKPIKRLSVGTQQLISGHYKTVIEISSKDELGQLSENFNSLANTLKENEQARRRWIADISHELRTPLAILKGEIEAIQDGIRPSGPDAIASLHAEVEHLNHLINDLYELSMSDIGALNYQKAKIDPLSVLANTVDSFRGDFKSAGIALQFNVGDLNLDKVTLLADAARLKQLFSNLLKNTLRYTDSPGTLLIEAAISSTELILNFKDSSPGVKESEIPSLFERLYRVESSRNRATGGAGLGLSICQNIVTAHEGKITAKASELGGIWISIILPFKALTQVKPNKREC